MTLYKESLPQVMSEVCMIRQTPSRCGSDGMHGVELSYDTFGKKMNPAVILIMGLTSQKIRFPNSFCQRLASEGFFVIRFDNRDVGRSTHVVKSRFHRFECIGRLLWVGALRILREWGKPFFGIWVLLLMRAWQRSRLKRQTPRLVACLIALWVAKWHRPKVAYTVADMAVDALELLDALRIPHAHLMGYSMGGMIAQFIARHHPERVSSVCLISTCSPNTRLLLNPKSLIMIAVNSGLSYIPGAPKQLRTQGTKNLWMYISAPGQDEAQEELAMQEHARSSQDLDAFLRQCLAIMDFCSGDAHWAPPNREKSIRTLVIHGLLDNLLPINNGFDLAKRMKCRCVVLPSVSHDSFPAGQDDILIELKAHLCEKTSELNTSSGWSK